MENFKKTTPLFLLCLLFFSGLSFAIHAQDGLQAVASDLSGERIFHSFTHNGTRFFVSAKNDDKGKMRLWKLVGNVSSVVADIRLSGGQDGFVHADDPRFFAQTARWIYYISQGRDDTQEQLYRTDGNLVQRVSNFEGGNKRFYAGAVGYHSEDLARRTDFGPLFLHHVLPDEPDRFYFLVRNTQNYITNSLLAITDGDSYPTMVEQRAGTIRGTNDVPGVYATPLLLRAGFIVVEGAIYVNRSVLDNDSPNRTDHSEILRVKDGSAYPLAYDANIDAAVKERIAKKTSVLHYVPSGFFNQDSQPGTPVGVVYQRHPWKYPMHAIVERDGVENIAFFIRLEGNDQGITSTDVSFDPDTVGLAYMPIEGANAFVINSEGQGYVTTSGDEPVVVGVTHGGKKKIIFPINDAYGEGMVANRRRGMALLLSDGTTAGTKRLGYFRKVGELGTVVFEEVLQVGNFVYARVLGEGLYVGSGDLPDYKVFVVIDLDNPTSFPAHPDNIKFLYFPDAFFGGKPSGNITQIAEGDVHFMVKYGPHIYYAAGADLRRVTSSVGTVDSESAREPIVNPEVFFDTLGGTVSSEAPVILDGALYFFAKIGGERWGLYKYDGTTIHSVLFLSADSREPSDLYLSETASALSFVTGNNVYVVDAASPTFVVDAGLSVQAGATNALARFTTAELVNYQWVLSSSSTAPTASQLRVGRDSTGVAIATNVLGDQLASACVEEHFALTDLTASTNYFLHFVMMDEANNHSPITTTPITTTATGEVVLPALDVPLRVAVLEHNTATVTYTPNKAATAYWVSVPANNLAPTTVQIMAGKHADDTAAVAGSVVSTTVTAASIVVPIATPETACQLYLVLKDADGLTAKVARILFTSQPTNAYAYGLTLSERTVTPSTSDHTMATATFKSSATGAPYYWVVQPADMPTLRRDLLLASMHAGGKDAGSGRKNPDDVTTNADAAMATTFTISSLTAGVDYTLYLTVSDGRDMGDYLAVQSFTFTAGGVIATVDAPSVDNTAGTASVSFLTALSGSFYWLTQSAALPVPSAAAIRGGHNANGVAQEGFSSAGAVTTNSSLVNTFMVRNLRFSGDYSVYILFTDLDDTPVGVTTTTFNYVAPAMPTSSVTPTASGIAVAATGEYTADVTFTPDASGTYYWVVQDASEAAPSVTQVLVGLKQTGVPASHTHGASGTPMLADMETTFALANLVIGTSYTVHLVLEDRYAIARSAAVLPHTFTHEAPVAATEFLSSKVRLETVSRAVGTVQVEALAAVVEFTSSVTGYYAWAIVPRDEVLTASDLVGGKFSTAAAGDGWGRDLGTYNGTTGGIFVTKNIVEKFQIIVPKKSEGRIPGRHKQTGWTIYIALSGTDSIHASDSTLESLAVDFPLYVPSFTSDPVLTGTEDSWYEITFTIAHDGINHTKWYWLALDQEEQYRGGSSVDKIDKIKSRVDWRGAPVQLAGGFTTELLFNQDTKIVRIRLSPTTLNRGKNNEEYRMYILLSDAETRTNYSKVDASIYFTRGHPTPPVFSSPLTVGQNTGDFTKVKFNMSKHGRYYWLVQPADGRAVPTTEQIKMGMDGNFNVLRSARSGRGLSWGEKTARVVKMDDLSGGHGYDIFVLLGTNSGRILSDVARLYFVAGRNQNPMATALQITPNSANSTEATATFTGSHHGEYYWMLQPQSVTKVPDGAQVRYGVNGHGALVSSLARDMGLVSSTDSTTFPIMGLTPATSYNLFVALDDGVSLGEVVQGSFTSGGGPAPPSAPLFMWNPEVTMLTTSTARVIFTPTAPGKYYWVLQPDVVDNANPTAIQVKAGQRGGGTSAGATFTNGSAGITMMVSEQAVDLASMLPATNYEWFVVLENTADGLLGEPEHIAFRTAALSPMPPDFTSGPNVSQTGAVTFTADKTGTYYWVLQLAEATPYPTKEQLKEGKNGAGVAVGAGLRGQGIMADAVAATFDITGLTDGINYALFVLLINDADHAEREVKKALFTYGTAFTSAVAPRLSIALAVPETTAVTATAIFTPNAAGRYYWVVFPLPVSASASPDSTAVKAGTDKGGRVAAGRKGPRSGVPMTAKQVTISITDLTADGAYRIFVVLAADNGEATGTPQPEDFTTKPASASTPGFVSDPEVVAITSNTASIVFTPEVAGKYYWVVQEDDISAGPNKQNIKNGQDGNGEVVDSDRTSASSGAEMTATEQSFIIGGLVLDVDYTLYLLLEDVDGNPHGEVSLLSFTTIFFGTAEERGWAVRLSPNPVQDVLNVRTPQAGRLSLYDLSGRLLVAQRLAVGENAVSFGNYRAGVYLLRVVFNGRETLHRVVKR